MPDESEGFPAERAVDAGVTRWRKRPIVIEAWQWNPGDLAAAGAVVGVLLASGADFHHPSGDGETTTLAIATLEGEMLAKPGDWIIRGVQGEFYPCKPDIFEATYEDAGSAQSGVTRWTCTQDQMIDALHRTRQCRWMNDPALTAMAREILAQLPEAGPDQSGEIARLKTERAEMTGQLIMAKEGVWGS